MEISMNRVMVGATSRVVMVSASVVMPSPSDR